MSHFDGITIRETNHFSKYKPKHTYRTISPLHLLSIVNISAPVEHSITSLTYPDLTLHNHNYFSINSRLPGLPKISIFF
jgi:hypothetical protein